MRQHTVILLIVAVLLAACGGEPAATDAGTTTAEPPAEITEATEAATPTETAAATEATETAGATETTGATGSSGATVAVAASDLGEVLVDGDGRTLYLFLPDEQGASTCYDSCAENWPPLEGPAEAGADADEALLATTDRDDGTQQVTYGGWPLYYFAADAQPGETNGQGVGDVWYVVDVTGEPVDAAATEGPTAAGATSTGLGTGTGEGSGGDSDEDY